MGRLESIRPGLTQSQDPVTGEMTQQPLYQAILNRIYNRASAEKGILRARKTAEGMTDPLPLPYTRKTMEDINELAPIIHRIEKKSKKKAEAKKKKKKRGEKKKKKKKKKKS